jgi:outer membrane immunogenic protein
MKRAFFAFVSLAALAGAAAAADLPPPMAQPYYKVPAYVPAPVYSWTGFYVGINGGGGFGQSSWDSPATGNFNIDGGVVGGTVGYNYQFGQAVAGIEGDVDWADIYNTTTQACPAGCKTSDSWLSTVRGRLGFAADRFMPFVTGGLAVGDISASSPGLPGATTTNAGWTIGGGIEMSLIGNWSAKAEYLYVDLGKFNCGTNCGAAVGVNDNVSFTTNLVRAGVNYRF